MRVTKDEAEQLLTGDFGKRLLRTTCDYCIPIFWSTPQDREWCVENNATGFLLDCGKGTFVVTAAHVYESYLKRRSQRIDICPQLGDLRFSMDERVVGYLGSGILDIVTFTVTSKEIDLLRKPVLKGNQALWPSPSVKVGEGALFAGFPGLQRTDSSADECGFGFYASLTPVSSVSERHFGCVFDRSKWVDAFGKGFPQEGYDLGGISGAPVLVVDESEAGILSWRLAGIAYNAANNLGEIMLAHHARFINEDGSLERA
jgi:hypothetical protein